MSTAHISTNTSSISIAKTAHPSTTIDLIDASERWGIMVTVELAGDNCVASAGVIFAKKAGLPQLVAGSIKSQGVALPPHSKFVVFTVRIALARYLFRLSDCLKSCCEVA